MTSQAFLQATRTGTVDGPLQGYHREWYVVRPGDELADDMGRLKVGEPREGIRWFDRRYFGSEEELLLRLPGHHVPRVPPVRRLGSHGPAVFGFIEGDPLNELAPAGTPLKERYVDQIMEVFGALSGVRAADAARWGIGTLRGEPAEDSGRFLEDLIAFTRDEVHAPMLPEFGELFDRLGVSADVLGRESWLASEAKRMTRRPFCLLHGDLHRANFIVDADDSLWTIDWELAAVGDPLYDLATHLHLMRYPADQEREVEERWRAAAGERLPGADAGFDADLPRYRAYKCVQSVYTDVVRHAVKVRDCGTPGEREAQLHHSAKVVEDALRRAGDRLGTASVPGPWAVEHAYEEFCRASGAA
jgi:hypothetical protein